MKIMDRLTKCLTETLKKSLDNATNENKLLRRQLKEMEEEHYKLLEQIEHITKTEYLNANEQIQNIKNIIKSKKIELPIYGKLGNSI